MYEKTVGNFSNALLKQINQQNKCIKKSKLFEWKFYMYDVRKCVKCLESFIKMLHFK